MRKFLSVSGARRTRPLPGSCPKTHPFPSARPPGRRPVSPIRRRFAPRCSARRRRISRPCPRRCRCSRWISICRGDCRSRPVFWFDKRLRVWLSAQDKPAPLAIVISGTGSDGNTAKLSTLRAVLYAAGYHVLTMPSPTFPGFIVSTSSTGVAGDLEPGWTRFVRRDGRDHRAPAAQGENHRHRRARIQPGRRERGHREVHRRDGAQAQHSPGGDDQSAGQPVLLGGEARQAVRQVASAMAMPASSAFISSCMPSSRICTAHPTGSRSTRISCSERPRRSCKTDAQFSAAIALTFRIALANVFFAGDLYSGAGVVVDPRHPPKVGDSLEGIAATLRTKTFAEYFTRIFAPYYLKRRPRFHASRA